MTTAAAIDPRKRPLWQQRLQAFFANTAVELTIGGLIVISVALTILELSLDPSPLRAQLGDINYAITALFALELVLRYAAAGSKKRFFREFWVDILAVLPLLRTLRFARLLRLLRLLRILRLIGIFSRYASSFPYIFRRGAIEYMMVCGLILLTVLFSTGAILALEQDNPQLDSFEKAFWYSIYTLLAGEPIAETPHRSLGGHLVAVSVMFMALTVFAMFTGTVSAFMVDRLRRDGRMVQWDEICDHLILCGWNRRAEIVVREFCTALPHNRQPIVVITELGANIEMTDPKLRKRVFFLHDDFTRVEALEQAGIQRAKTCVILSDAAGNRSEQDVDARTILAALTVEKLNPRVYTCAELHNRAYGSHLEMGHVNDYVVSGEYSGFLLAQAALYQGFVNVFSELLTHEHGNQFCHLKLSDHWKGTSFLDLMIHVKSKHNAILVAVRRSGESFQLNPHDYQFQGDEQVVVIAERPFEL